MITIGIYDTNKIFRAATASLLQQNEEFNVLQLECDTLHIADKIKVEGINILVVNVHDSSDETFTLIKQISQRFERVRILVISSVNNQHIIVQSIRNGAKGFIAIDAEPRELVEAIYVLRNGFDYYSKSIAHILVGKYISEMTEKSLPPAGIEQLSSRQIEIIKLWGQNKSNKEIADQLFLSVRTVESHKNHIMQRLNLKTTVDMIKFGIKNNLIDL